MSRPQGDHDIKRTEMAQAAMRVVARRGLKAASLMDIAAELGCTTGALRHYFTNKSELLRFAKDNLFDSIRDQLIHATIGRVGLDRLRAMASALLPLDAKRLLMWRIYTAFVGESVGNSEMMRIQRRRDIKDIDIIRDEILSLQEQGYASAKLDATTEAFALTCFIDGIGVNATISSKAMSHELQKQFIDNYVTRMFSCNQ